MNILLIERDTVSMDRLRRSLKAKGDIVRAVDNLTDGQRAWKKAMYDVVILSIHVPLAEKGNDAPDGLRLLQDVRTRGDRTPVLILTAQGKAGDHVAGLNAGADDCMSQPLDMDELHARLHALTRRVQEPVSRVCVGSLVLDKQARLFSINRCPLRLPLREYEVLCELMNHPQHIVSKTVLSKRLTKNGLPLGDNALEAFISRIRRKLIGSGATIRTMRGMGYLLEDSQDEAMHEKPLL